MDSPPARRRHPHTSQNIRPGSTAPTTTPVNGLPLKMSARTLPFLPASLEIPLLSIYPATLVAGALFALLDPAARSAPYNPATQSHFASTAPSYFAKKSNIFNQFFVKQGWAWVTTSYFFFLFT